MENEQQTIEAAVQEVYPLDDAAIEILAEMSQQRAALETSMNAVLAYFAKQHKLKGQWRLSPNGKELTKAQ